MNSQLQAILEDIQKATGLTESEKELLIKKIKDADKEQGIAQFKLGRLERDKYTLSVMLEESIQDLEKKTKAVEEQNHELEIESALERVRSVAMGMKKREDMLDVCKTIAQQLALLNVKEIRNVQTAIFYDEKGSYTNYEYYAKHDKLLITEVDYTDHDVAKEFAKRMQGGPNQVWMHEFRGEEVKEWLQYQRGTNVFIDTYLETADSLTYYWYSLGPVAMGTSTYFPLKEEEIELFKRFRNVFELAYRRYLDIEKAEAQAREAQIEAALERVRSRTMAMHKSSELIQTAELLFDQLKQLGAELQGVAFAICDKNSNIVQKWTSIGVFTHPYTIEPGEQRMYEAWKNQVGIYEEVYEGERQKKYYETFMEIPAFKQGLQKFINSGYPIPTWQKNHAVTFKHGYLLFITTKPFNETQIFLRFGKVFEQTYTRFLDLGKAEAQARESQIEAALERIRSNSMAMHHSNDLIKVINVVKEQLMQLGIHFHAANFVTGYGSEGYTMWLASPSENYPEKIYVPQIDQNLFSNVNASAEKGHEFVSYTLSFEEKNIYFKHLFENTPMKNTSEEGKRFVFESKGMASSAVLLNKVRFNLMNLDLIPYTDEENNIIKRIAYVFEQSYTRFLDLQKAEEQTREALIEGALERVRGKAMAMHSSQDLVETIGVFYRELKMLTVTPRRCGVALMNKETRLAELTTMNTTEEGDSIDVVGQIKMSGHPVLDNVFKNWLIQKEYHAELRGNQIKEYYQVLRPQISFPDYPHDVVQYGYYFMFAEGDVYAWTEAELAEEHLNIYRRFASVISLTYKRYLDLQKAEAQAVQAEKDLVEIKAARKKAEDTLVELQATQKQLVQSEKMASLGELTAGIAHEIQNPLNFVNNFSDVSNELLEEMKEELKKGNKEDAMAIADDVKQNLEKILFHGKRADGIVKSMLQHSRTSSGKKEPTDINALCDEYLRLAFHGLRAKDKSFNAKFETHLDISIEKINLVPQDIGRVILNLINNAFYAVSERKKINENGYEPEVLVSTKNLKDKVEIRVKDNGTGIPQKVLDKIFQPFFTTKPTGQGTGLGLSLSYDIITKGHNGELKVETKEGKGSEFMVLLPNV